MKRAIRVLVLLAVGFGLTACGGANVARQTAPEVLSVASKGAPVALVPKYDVERVEVSVPRDLRVSEANVYYPLADIVWRGEPIGDRHRQVQTILQEGIGRGVKGMTSGRPVALEIRLERFHSLTEKTRYTFGGVHSIKFVMTVRDLETGIALDGPRMVVADVKGSGGSKAIAEEQMGRTMRVVITERLEQVIRRELSQPVAVPQGAPVSQGAAPATGTFAPLY